MDLGLLHLALKVTDIQAKKKKRKLYWKKAKLLKLPHETTRNKGGTSNAWSSSDISVISKEHEVCKKI